MEINMINEYLKEQLWMDFEVCNMNCEKIEMLASINGDMFIIAKEIEVVFRNYE